MLIFPKVKTRLLISVCQVFSVLSLWNCFRHLRWKHWEFCLSAMMFEAQQKVPKNRQWFGGEKHSFSLWGRHSGRFTLRWCSQPCGAHAGPPCFLSGESLLCLSSGVCACGEVLAFRSALAPPVHRQATHSRIHADLRQVSLPRLSAHMTGYTSTLDGRKRRKIDSTVALI